MATQKKNPGANNFKSTYSFNFKQHSNEDDTVDLMNKNNGIKCHTSRGNRCLLISSSFYKMFFPDLMNKTDSIKWHTAIYENNKFSKYWNMKYFDMKFNIHL